MNDIRKKIAAIESILADPHSVHPPACGCAIKSRDAEHHDRRCPYRLLKELMPELRDALPTEAPR